MLQAFVRMRENDAFLPKEPADTLYVCSLLSLLGVGDGKFVGTYFGHPEVPCNTRFLPPDTIVPLVLSDHG